MRKPVSPPIKPFIFLCWAASGLLIVYVFYTLGLLYATRPISEISISKAASLGDSYGALTSLFACLGFAGVLATIFLQREELKLTRRELEETKNTLARQRFEDLFFRMIELSKRNLDGIMIDSRAKPSRRLHGLDALDHLNVRFRDRWKVLGLIWVEDDSRLNKIAYASALDSMIRKIYIRQTRYVQTLINLLDLAEKEGEGLGLRLACQETFCSQLTAVELTYLFYQSYIHPEFVLLRRVLCCNSTFKARVAMLQIPDDHRKAWDFLYGGEGTKMPERRTRYGSKISKSMKIEAASEIRAMRQQIRQASFKRNADND